MDRSPFKAMRDGVVSGGSIIARTCHTNSGSPLVVRNKNLKLRAEPMAGEYGFRFCCEDGFRVAKWRQGFAESRVT
jgi:hypothetical protein